jgi:outer membrane lipoprotein
MATKHTIGISLWLALLALGGCATTEPFPVTPHSPTPDAVRHDVSGHQQQTATWGGTILGVEVNKQDTLVSILARPLDKYGIPQLSDRSDGRFIARIKGFADPVLFSIGRRVSFTGTISGSETRKIGDYFYVYPLLTVSKYRLWPVESVRLRSDDEWWYYDPWFYGYPWYPYSYPYLVYVPTRPVIPGPPPVKK